MLSMHRNETHVDLPWTRRSLKERDKPPCLACLCALPKAAGAYIYIYIYIYTCIVVLHIHILAYVWLVEVTIFYLFGQLYEIDLSLLIPQKQPKQLPNLFQRGVEHGKYSCLCAVPKAAGARPLPLVWIHMMLDYDDVNMVNHLSLSMLK